MGLQQAVCPQGSYRMRLGFWFTVFRAKLSAARMEWTAQIGVMALAALATAGAPSNQANAQDKLRFAVGPFQPTASDTKKAYEPFFKYLAGKLGRDYELVVTTDWAGIAIALANKQADIAWMGPWGYVLANNEGGAQAIATVKYNGKPSYHVDVL
jgi:phosphonate transport system substrate-binding protein